MKTKLLWIISILMLFVSTKISAQTNLAISSAVVSTDVCADNSFTARFNTTQGFTLNIDALVRSGSSTGPIVSAFPHPNCANQMVGNNPVIIEIISITSSIPGVVTLASMTPILNQTTFSWNVLHSMAGSNVEVFIDYYVKLDCSLIPQGVGGNPNQSLFFIQTWTPFTTANVNVTPVYYPYITNQYSVPVDGYYEQQSDMIFEYKNIGSAPIEMNFTFEDLYLQNCGIDAAYEPIAIDPIMFTVAVSNQTMLTFSSPYNNTPFSNHEIIGPGESLYIRHRVNINNCRTTCIELKEVQLKWQCTNLDPAVFCENCQNEYKTGFTFVDEFPSYTIERMLPLSPVEHYDNSCLGVSIPWKFKVTNTTQHTKFDEINIEFNKSANGIGGLSEIYKNSIDLTSCPSCTLTNFTDATSTLCPNLFDPPQENFNIKIEDLDHGQHVIFSFNITKCDNSLNPLWETSLLNSPKFFNQWTGTPSCTTKCGNIFYSPNTNELPFNNLGGGLSSHSSSSPSKDVDLELSFNHMGPTDFTVSIPSCAPAPLPCLQPPFYGPYIATQVIDLQGLFGNDDDMQVLGYTGGISSKSGILRATIHCEQGLVLDNFINDVSLKYGSQIWAPIPGSFHSSLPAPDCLDANYYIYYDISSIANPDDFFTQGKFEFKLMTCCPAQGVSDYDVSFSLLMNDDCYAFTPGNPPTCITTPPAPAGSCPWLPLSSRGFYINVHCPGCRAPGIIIDEYKMKRISYGFEDATSDRIADVDGSLQPIPIDEMYSQFDQIRRDRSVHGDKLEDRLVAHFNPGSLTHVDPLSYPNTNYHGYTYSGTMTSNFMHLGLLQLRKKIGSSGTTKMNLEVLSVELYIDQGFGTGIPVDAAEFNDYYYTGYLLPQSPTIFHHLYTLNSNPTLASLAVERQGDEYMFNFKDTDLASIAGNAFTVFSEGQQYRLVITYQVCGNTYSESLYYPTANQLEIASSIENEMWLTGGNSPFTLSSTNPHSSHPHMPNFIEDPSPNLDVTNVMEASVINLKFDILNPPSNCTGCTSATQQNFAEHFKFVCETYGGNHTFYSTDVTNTTLYNFINSAFCNKSIQTIITNTFGRKGSTVDLFPYEFRPPNLFPKEIEIKVPVGYALSTTISPTIHSLYCNYFGNGNYLSTNNFNLSIINTPTITIDQTNPSFNTAINTITCVKQPSIPINSLIIGDEESIQVIDLLLEPNCLTPPSFYGLLNPIPDTDVKIKFESNVTGCNLSIFGCNHQHIQKNMFGPNYLNHSNPNLQALFTPTGSASTSELCWDFSISNVPVTQLPGDPLFTGTQNVFLAVPIQPGSVVNNWTITSMSSFNNNGTPVNLTAPTEVNGIFNIASEMKYNQYSIISGEVCAYYEPCGNPGTFDFKWGWGCAGIPSSINDPTLCAANIHATPIVIDDEKVNVIVDEPKTYSPPGFTLCQSGSVMNACFKSMEPGNVSPTSAIISIAQSSQIYIDAVYIVNTCGGGGFFQVNPTPNPNVSFTIDQASLIAHGFIDDGMGQAFMEQTDCISIKVEYTPLCHFEDPWKLPNIEMNFLSYCQAPVDVIAPFPSIPSYGTVCTDCFSVVKTATPSVIMQDLQQVQYEIEVCSNNQPNLINLSVGLSDYYPNGYTPVGVDPFLNGPITLALGTDLPWTGCTTYTFQGLHGIPGFNTCNEAILEYTDNAQNPVSISSLGCVDVMPNCNNNVDLVISNGKASDYPSGLPLFVQSIAINGVFTVDVNFTFDNKIIKMGPGAEIRIDQMRNLTIKSTYIDACQVMWNGILLDYSAGIFIVKNSYIADAYTAVKVSGRNRVVLSSSRFEDNFITLYAPPGFMASAYQIGGNIFSGSGSLAPPFTNQFQQPINNITSLGNYPLAAIFTNKTFINLLDINSIIPNTFSNLSNGIISYMGGYNVENCIFENIQPDPVYNIGTLASFGFNYNGSGIYADGFQSLYGITQKGFGNTVGSTFSFSNCNYAIFSDKSSIVAEDNNITNVNTAFRVQLTKSNIGIGSNLIDAWQDAVQLIQCDGSISTNVWNNDITFGNNDPWTPYIGVRVDENLMHNNNSRINFNRINFRPGAIAANIAIRSFATSKFNFTNNVIEMDDNIFNRDGILMLANEYCIASCNQITGSTDIGVDDQSAIRVLLGDKYTIGCNNISNTANGIFIQSTMHSANIKGNDFHDHTFAFHYGPNGATDEQDFKGNIWHNQVPNNAANGGKLAQNENTNYDVSLGPWFEVNPSSNILLYPDFNYQDPPDWFKIDVGTNFLCENTLLQPVEIYCNEFRIDDPTSISDFEMRIAEDSIFNDPFTDATRWMLKWGLLSKLQENPNLLNDSLMLTFFNNLQNTALSFLKNVEGEKNLLIGADSLLADYMEQRKGFLDVYDLMLTEKMMVLKSALDSSLNVDSIVAEINSSLLFKDSLLSESNSFLENYFLNKEADASNLIYGNASIASEAIIETNEIQLNEIYLSTIGKNIFELSEFQKMQLYNIAGQCPLSGGNAVIKARSFISLFDDKVHFNDKDICWNAGIFIKQQQSYKQNFKASVYPNPTNSRATLKYDSPIGFSAKFVIYNSFGVVVSEYELPGGISTFEFNTQNLAPGIYHYILYSRQERISNGKIAILR